VLPALPKLSVFSDSIFPDGGKHSSSTPLLDFAGVDICGCLSGFKYTIFLGAGFLRCGHVSSRQSNKIFFVAIVFLSFNNAIETIKSLLFQTCSLEKCTHIQGRNYHNRFAVTLSTNAMFTDVLHLQVIDPAHYTCTLL
jgi:hypothetical protein